VQFGAIPDSPAGPARRPLLLAYWASGARRLCQDQEFVDFEAVEPIREAEGNDDVALRPALAVEDAVDVGMVDVAGPGDFAEGQAAGAVDRVQAGHVLPPAELLFG